MLENVRPWFQSVWMTTSCNDSGGPLLERSTALARFSDSTQGRAMSPRDLQQPPLNRMTERTCGIRRDPRYLNLLIEILAPRMG